MQKKKQDENFDVVFAEQKSFSMFAEEILLLSQSLTIYLSFLILFAGFIGHMIDILVFTNSKLFLKSQSVFYLTTESIVNSIHLLISFSSRIAINGFQNDLTRTSLIWCKFRSVITTSLTILSLSIVCFAALDQYLSTSYNPYIKQMSTLKLAHHLTFIAIVVCILHGIPFFILMKIESTQGCSPYNDGLSNYIIYVYYVILTGLLPIAISSIFATLAYLNVRRIVQSRILIVRRRLEKQLTAMILIRVAFLVVITFPYVIFRIYTLKVYVNPDNLMRRAIMQLISSITYTLFYLNYAVCNRSMIFFR